eukprot:m.347559 g.347559  ORF g.347559 m.347559 type:complete len:345 (+) comp33282_c0_seq1:2-1036(+)
MNVLHLHFSDFCRFAIESKVFPQLTANLTGLQAGHYTQDDIADMIAYAKARGIRVVPEIDLPGHARGLLPLEASGLHFCGGPSNPTRSQIYDDPDNQSYALLSKLITEIASLFPDNVMHVGSDETRVLGDCTLKNTAGLEHSIFMLLDKLGKRPMAWVNALTTTHVATPNTILGTWATVYGMPPLVTGDNYSCVGSTYMYLNKITGTVGSYTNYWRDIADGVNSSNMHLMLGGEVSMWTDDYCYIHQCGSSTGATPTAASFYGPDADTLFAKSIAGVLFPRTFVGAGSFWNYNSSFNAMSPGFVKEMGLQTARMMKRGLDTCPNNCTCDLLTRCGEPYSNTTMS